ncbi:MAG: hypothetical protein CBB87_05100 [Micavibrio sp. TMED27]|nr:hypothetical protein [Micavibrio sp.]OUT91406.1 MAG: hypothetical protein CBB87_05100 [Micavibrio sp. TMED27]|tara:strand:+ start:3910 stop:4161 length:252 start_codon:yes stop_codon:yes gene_type:complete
MHNIFDNFLDKDTWHKDHPGDNAMFYSALSQVIDDESFCSDEMAEYMRNRKNVSRDNNDIFSFRIQTLQSAALHISDYKKLIG